MELTKLDPPEKSRTYLYPNEADPTNPHRIQFVNVTAIAKRESGSHRLETADGRKIIALPGFLAIELEVDAWTF